MKQFKQTKLIEKERHTYKPRYDTSKFYKPPKLGTVEGQCKFVKLEDIPRSAVTEGRVFYDFMGTKEKVTHLKQSPVVKDYLRIGTETGGEWLSEWNHGVWICKRQK